MRVSVAIPTLRPGDDLPPLLDALASQKTTFEVEILIADSGSPPWELGTLGFHGVRLLKIPPGTFNHGGTRNLLVQEAKGDIIAFLTQDALPQGPSYLQALIDGLLSIPDAKAAYARQLPRPLADPKIKARLAEAFPPGAAPIPQRLPPEGLESLSPLRRYQLCRYDHVASAALRSSLIDMPLPDCPFGEDILWAKMVLEGGGALAYVPGAVVQHSHRRGPRETYRRSKSEHQMLAESFGVRSVPSLGSLARGALSLAIIRGGNAEGVGHFESTIRGLAELMGQFMGPRSPT